MSTTANRQCMKLVFGFVVFFLVVKCINSVKKQDPSLINPAYTDTTKKPTFTTHSEELITLIEDLYKPPDDIDPENHDPCILGSSKLYLSWWIDDNGSLAVPEDRGINLR